MEIRVGADIEVYPGFSPASWEGGFLPIKVRSLPDQLAGLPRGAPVISGTEIDFDAGVASVRSSASRNVVDYAVFCFVAEAIARVTGGRLEMEGVECRLSPTHLFGDAIEAIRRFAAEASSSDFHQAAFESWEAVE